MTKITRTPRPIKSTTIDNQTNNGGAVRFKEELWREISRVASKDRMQTAKWIRKEIVKIIKERKAA